MDSGWGRQGAGQALPTAESRGRQWVPRGELQQGWSTHRDHRSDQSGSGVIVTRATSVCTMLGRDVLLLLAQSRPRAALQQTCQVLHRRRVGLGGWLETEGEQAHVSWDRASGRIEGLESVAQMVKGSWCLGDPRFGGPGMFLWG